MPKRPAALSRVPFRRKRQVVGVVSLLIVAALILTWARYSTEYARDVLINVGASVIIVAMSYAIFDPIFEEIRRARVQEQPYFDDVAFCRNVARASRDVRVMDTCNHMLEGNNRNLFLDSLREAASRRANVQILLLDPDSTAAEQRAGEIRADVRAKVVENLRYLYGCQQQLPVAERDRLQVRVYDALPSIQFFQYDYRALVSFFPAGGRASASTHLELAVDTPLGEFVHGRFEDLWGHDRTRTLQSWLTTDVSIWDEARVLESHSLQYLSLDGHVFLDATPIQELLIEHGRPHVRFEVHSSRLPTEGGRFYSFDRVQVSSSPSLGSLMCEFAEKYGDGYNANSVERLIVALHAVPPE